MTPKEIPNTIYLSEYDVKTYYDGTWIHFYVYPVSHGINLETDKKVKMYGSKENPSELITEFNKDTCYCEFRGLFCWRGIWEGRIYFDNDEYFGEDLSKMAEIYEQHIVVFCKNYIISHDPDNTYEY